MIRIAAEKSLSECRICIKKNLIIKTMELSTFFLTFVAAAFAMYYFFFRKLRHFEKLGILHIKPWPVIGNMLAPILRQCTFIEMIDRAYYVNEDAMYVGFYDFSVPAIMIRSPKMIKDIAVKHFDHFADHRGFLDTELDPLFANNLFSLRGKKWKRMRSILSPAFTSSKMKGMFKLMSATGRNFADFLAKKSLEKPTVINSKDAFTRYTNDVIASCAFGISVDSMRNPDNDFYVLGRRATNFEGILGIKIFIIRSFPWLAKIFNIKVVEKQVERFFENVVRETVEMREREGISRPDMIQLMMESRDNKMADQPGLTMLDMTSQAFSFFFGGFDTSSTLMCFAVHAIAVDATIQKRLQDDVDEILGEANGDVSYEAINKMEYLDAVVSEALRLYPIAVILDRVCVKAFELPPALPGAKPVTLLPGDNIWFPVSSLHKDPKYFRNPETFDPERFLGSDKGDIDPFVYIPFGQGPRMCIGNRFALLETKVLIFHLLAKCHVKPSSKMILPLELSKSTLIVAAKGGFWLELESRNNPKKS